MSKVPNQPRQGFRVFPALLSGITVFLVIQLISLYLSWPKQFMLGCVSVLIGLIVNRISSSRTITIGLMLISMTATLRYGWWRIRLVADYFLDPSNNRLSMDSVLMLILISAEAYTVLIMVLGYMQTAWPLKRKPLPMPADDSRWPHVDVLIPTYNEPLSLVRYTALAAINIDYPPDKLHVYILDDGSREEFREFAEAAAVGYVTRKEHGHAKAGNINHALTTMNSPFVTIFDCDHVPTRSFLQMTMGWMLADSNLAMLQTPHHFYSPDPFERNLLQYKTIPNEAALFYGIVQDGNDFWNATFFCGSCALIRRTALNDVGGIAVETVTEDAHTSLRMQKQGYNTAYINIPQAAGLSTETLSAHVGQRIRWARGMIQIFRTDNPLFATGMKLSQRLCYLNAMIHFLYAVPRLVFLLAPLVYMLLGMTIIPGYWVAIIAYSMPHLILSNLTNSRIQGRHRHSFWNEIYEAVLAPYILAPTLLALINPKLGKFNVTDKGNTLADTRFDHKIATPTRCLLALNLLGLLVAPYRMFIKDPDHPGTVLMNLVWIIFNMVILGVAAAVAYEQRQRRTSVRIEVRIPMNFVAPDGTQISGVSVDMSVSGASVHSHEATHLTPGDFLRVKFPEQSGDAEIGARVVGVMQGELRLAFHTPTIAEQETLTRAIYSRADAWIGSMDSKEVDKPLKSLGRVMVLSSYGIYQICRSAFPEKRSTRKPQAAQTAATIFMACVLGSCSHLFGTTPIGQTPADSNSDANYRAPVPTAVRLTEMAKIETGKEEVDQSQLPSSQKVSTTQVLSLLDMGQFHPVEMRGPHSYSSVGFTLPFGLVSRRATLRLLYRFDPELDPDATSLTIKLNGVSIGTLKPSSGTSLVDSFAQANVVVPTDFLVRSNNLAFEFAGSEVMHREDQVQNHVLCRVSPSSTLEVGGDRLPWHNDFSQLPLPFFDGDLQTSTTVPIVFLSKPSSKTLQAAGVVASWLGLHSNSKLVRFAVSTGQIPQGNAILFTADRETLPDSLKVQLGEGPILALRGNPVDALGSLLVIAGGNEQQLLIAAQTLSLTEHATGSSPPQGLALTGDTVPVPSLTMPNQRRRGDAPRWMPTEKAAQLLSCPTQPLLQTDGSTPIPVYFHLPPDLFYGERQTLPLDLHFRYNSEPIAAGSYLRVVVNGSLVNEAALSPGVQYADMQRKILIPVAALRPFGNTILFNFDFIPANRDANENQTPPTFKGQVLCTSSLDIRGLASWARMPNLRLFADAGFPFTRMADLSQTTVVLPSAPSADEISVYLDVMGQFGAQTGYPALRVMVDGPTTVVNKDRDYLVLGTIANQPAIHSLEGLLPVTLEANGAHFKPDSRLFTVASTFDSASSRWWSWILQKDLHLEPVKVLPGLPDAMIEEIESPSSPNRSIVVIALKENSSANLLSEALLGRSNSGDIDLSVSLLRDSSFQSYSVVGEDYHFGNISWFANMRMWLTGHFLLLLFTVTILHLSLAVWTRDWFIQRAEERLRLTGSLDDSNHDVLMGESRVESAEQSSEPWD